MASPRQVYVAVIGTGGVGKCFLGQLSALASRLSASANSPIHLNTVLISRSKTCLQSPSYKPLSLPNWEDELAASPSPALSHDEIVKFLTTSAPKNARAVIVDNTSDQTLAEAYPLFLRNGISIVTPNKKAFSSTQQLWTDIFAASTNGPWTPTTAFPAPTHQQQQQQRPFGHVYHESSVGAGLPILSTLRDLIETGDRILEIKGVFSGTMSFLFNNFMPVLSGSSSSSTEGGAFSAEVAKARDLGYTEPDPRDDLNGLDVARKLTILARLAGLPVANPTSFPVQNLIPEALRQGIDSADAFMAALPQYDAEMGELRAEARKEGKVVRFVGSVDAVSGEIRVGLEKLGVGHPIAGLKGSDNVVSFRTERYDANPLVIQGPGAGGEQTAMGVTADLIKVLRLTG